MIEGIAFQLGEMSAVDMSKTFAGQQYKSIVSRMKKAYSAGFLKKEKPYFLFNTRSDFIDLIIHHSYKYNASALLLSRVNWDGLLKKSAWRSNLNEVIQEKRSEIQNYDSYIFVPYSPIEMLRVNK